MNCNIYGDSVLKWEHGDKKYCLHIMRDDLPDNPRECVDFTTMACFHYRYDLGDDIEEKTPEDFWRQLVRKHVSSREVIDAIQAEKLYGIRVTPSLENTELCDIYETYCIRTPIGRSEPKEYLEYGGIPRDAIGEYLIEDLTIAHCMVLMKPHAEWLPLYIYDHSGITMSCGGRTYPYNDPWDSSAVGWIIALKETIIEELALHEEETWREEAIGVMEAEVRIYDRYLTGDVYGFRLYDITNNEGGVVDADEAVEVASCWGFYGTDSMENGIVDSVGYGLAEAIRANIVTEGSIKKQNVTYTKFEF